MHVLWITLVALIIDQITKLIVLDRMNVGQSIPVLGDWLKLTFTENPGMAFGITFGPRGLVTILSITATILIFGYLFSVRKSYLPYRLSIAFILGGALGNIIDRVFYGSLFYNGSLFTGKVVDFIHVNVWRGYLPDWMPFIGGNYVALFPIWNVADMAIVAGVVGILFFQGRFQEELLKSLPGSSGEGNSSTSEEGTPEDAVDAAVSPVADNDSAPKDDKE